MPTTLEVIVTSVEEGIEAEAGGADRLELVRELGAGGLTPDLTVVEKLLAAVRIPVRVMVREKAAMSAGSVGSIRAMQESARESAALLVDGIVAGFVRSGCIDTEAMLRILAAAPKCRVTFHRAFDEVADPLAAIEQLKRIPQIDRILTHGGTGDWPERKKRLNEWQQSASPSMKILVAAGLRPEIICDLGKEPGLFEVHVGRAARVPQSVSGAVQRQAVRAIKSALE